MDGIARILLSSKEQAEVQRALSPGSNGRVIVQKLIASQPQPCLTSILSLITIISADFVVIIIVYILHEYEAK